VGCGEWLAVPRHPDFYWFLPRRSPELNQPRTRLR
jgi:hypothetical protein